MLIPTIAIAGLVESSVILHFLFSRASTGDSIDRRLTTHSSVCKTQIHLKA